MTAARSFITARRRSKALSTPPAADCTASLLHTVRASLRRGKRGHKLAWVLGNPGHNPARVTHRFPGRGEIFNGSHCGASVFVVLTAFYMPLWRKAPPI